jgi:hypothetical protein
MQEVIPRLWLGDIIAATNDVSLREKGIHSVLTAMQGELAVHPVPYIPYLPLHRALDVRRIDTQRVRPSAGTRCRSTTRTTSMCSFSLRLPSALSRLSSTRVMGFLCTASPA